MEGKDVLYQIGVYLVKCQRNCWVKKEDLSG